MICDFPWRYLYVSVRGDVYHCCVGPLPKYNLEKIDSFSDYWNSKELQHIRSLFLVNKFFKAGCYPACGKITAYLPKNVLYSGQIAAYDAQEKTGDEYLDSFPESKSSIPSNFEENQKLIAEEIKNKLCKVKSYPTRIHIETNTTCNLRCKMCTHGQTDPADWPKVDLSSKVLDKIKVFFPFLEYIEIQGGECFYTTVSKAPVTVLLKELAAANNKHMECLITTNGIGMNKEWVDFLISLNVLTHLSVSIDTVHPVVYSEIRRGGNTKKLLNNLNYLMIKKNESEANNLKLIFSSVLSLKTYPDLLSLDAICKKYGVVHLQLYPLTPARLNKEGEDSFYEENNIFTAKKHQELKECLAILEKIQTSSNKGDIINMIRSIIM